MKALLEEAVLFTRLTEMSGRRKIRNHTESIARNTMVQIKENLVVQKILSRRQLSKILLIVR